MTDAECTAEFKPVVTGLKEVKVTKTADTLYEHRALLYRFNKETNAWIQRGLGDVKIVRDLKTGTVSMAMHMEKTFRPCLACIVLPDSQMSANESSDRSWVWTTTDFADPNAPGTPLVQSFAIKFKTKEIADNFKVVYDKHKVENGPDGRGLAPPAASEEASTEEAPAKTEEPAAEVDAAPAAAEEAPAAAEEAPAAEAEATA